MASLGFTGVDSVRQGKVFDIELQTSNPNQAKAELNDMCAKLLANTVIEDYSVEII